MPVARSATTGRARTTSLRTGREPSKPSDVQLEHELDAVLLVPDLARLDEPELPCDPERRLVLRRDREDESPHAVLLASPPHQRLRRLGREAAAPVGRQDRVA